MRDALKFPLPASERISFLYFERCAVEREGHSLVAVSGTKRVQIPIGRTNTLMLGPGTTISQAGMSLCALEGALVMWVGEAGVRMYSAGHPRADSVALLWQAHLRNDETLRLGVARRVYSMMFGEAPPLRRSLDQLRGIEGSRVKKTYENLAIQHGMRWPGRMNSDLNDPLNAAISTATSALYGVTEAAILALGYSPAIGFLNSGDPRSFVYDVADTVKFKTVVPLAFEIAANSVSKIESKTRSACRDLFNSEHMAAKLVDIIERILHAHASD